MLDDISDICDIAVEIEDENWRGSGFAPQGAQAFCISVLERYIAALPQIDAEHTGLTVLLTSDKEIQQLNRDFRGKDAPTDILSFPSEDRLPEDAEAPAAGYLGDIALAYGVVARQAEEEKISIKDHTAHLLAHGLLHLLGYDHMNDADAAAMEAREIALLAPLGIRNPYL